MTGAWTDHLIVAPILLPLVGAVPVSSALVFDLGVFGLVVGATVLMLIALAHQSIRKLRAARTTTAQAIRSNA